MQISSTDCLGILSGTMNFIIPFYAYGYTVGTLSGKTDDYSTAAFAAFTANWMAHHMQIFTTKKHVIFSLSFPLFAFISHFHKKFIQNLRKSQIYGVVFGFSLASFSGRIE